MPSPVLPTSSSGDPQVNAAACDIAFDHAGLDHWMPAWFLHMSGGNKLRDLYDSLFGPDDDTAECAYSCAGQRPGKSAQVSGLPRDVMPASESVTKQFETKEHLQCFGPNGLSVVKAWLSSSQQVWSLP